MATSQVTVKLSPTEFDLVIESLTFLRDEKFKAVKHDETPVKEKSEARATSVQADNLIRNLRL